ncbi:MAG: hypothetical protein K6B14_07800 [Lachnospiraceae bacterium]|nr:hypothetical protein [Lachnospiraceae bacterium]
MKEKAEEKEKWKEDLSSDEVKALEEEKSDGLEVDEKFHATPKKESESADDDWKYIDDGFDAEMADFERNGGEVDDKLGDIVQALSTWRMALSNNYVLDDVMAKSQDVPTATAFGDMIRRIDEYEAHASGWSAAGKAVTASLGKLKSVATRLNETMMKAAAECYADIDEATSYRDLSEIAIDPTGFKAKKPLRQENKRVFERLNTYEDEIRGEKKMNGLVALFMPSGSGDKWTNQEKSYAESFMKDYSTKSEEKRRPYLDILTKKMFDIAISVEMLSPEYMAANMPKMEYFLTQLSYFEDVRNDPINAPYFHRYAEKEQKKLDIIDKMATSFTPGDFVRNVNIVNTRDKWYRPDSKDQKHLDDLMREHSDNDIINDYMYDTKVSITRLKNNKL